MSVYKKIKENLKSMQRVRKLHGMKPAALLYLTKIPLVKNLLRNTLVETKIFGSTMYLKVSDGGLHRRLLLAGVREKEHTQQIQTYVKPGMVGVDLGANVGYFALMEARLVGPSGKVYCIEPETGNLRLLHKNIQANGDLGQHMEVFQYLIGDHDGMEKLYLSEFGNVHSVSSARNKQGSIDVPMITLDSFMEQNELQPGDVDFIRMDIEGYEVMAFQGMKKILEAKTPFKIFMEFHPMYYQDWGWTFERLLRFLDAYGFKIRELAKVKHTNPDGTIRPHVVMQNPSIDDVLRMQQAAPGEGSQALLERS